MIHQRNHCILFYVSNKGFVRSKSAGNIQKHSFEWIYTPSLEAKQGNEVRGCDTLGRVAMNERGGNSRRAMFIIK